MLILQTSTPTRRSRSLNILKDRQCTTANGLGCVVVVLQHSQIYIYMYSRDTEIRSTAAMHRDGATQSCSLPTPAADDHAHGDWLMTELCLLAHMATDTSPTHLCRAMCPALCWFTMSRFSSVR